MCDEIEAKLREKLGLLREPTTKKGSPAKEAKETPEKKEKKEKKDLTSTT